MSRHGSLSRWCFLTHWRSKNEHYERSNMAYFRAFLIAVTEEMKKYLLWPNFLPLFVFFYAFPSQTSFCVCIRKIGIKTEQLAQSASFRNDFVAKANIGWLKIFQKAKNYVCMKHPVYLWHFWVAMARQVWYASLLTNNQKSSTVSDQIWRISA